MIFHTDEQGSQGWLDARRGVITGSRFKDARSKLKKDGKPSEAAISYAMDLARERVGGKPPEAFYSDYMKAGTEQEPFARSAYEIQTGNLVEQAGFITTDDKLFGVSVDGLVGDDGIIEIKTMVSSKTLFKAVVEEDISDYIDQGNGAMWLLGRMWVDFVLWAPDLEAAGHKGLHIIRVNRDEESIASLEEDLWRFAGLVGVYEEAMRRKVA